MQARNASAILGIWLFISVFCWHHQPGRGFNDLVVGLALFTSGYFGQYLRAFRFFDGLLGCWMVLSFFVLMASSFPERVHDGVLGLLVVGLAAMTDRDGDHYLDHWIDIFDRNPTLERRPLGER
jgi:uncharacterized RDD family membrane protein YckC